MAALLKWAAKRVLAVNRPRIVGVTGSAGKTSTKEAIYQALKTTPREPVETAEGNLNTEFGLPLAILKLSKPESTTAWVSTAWHTLRLGFAPPENRAKVLVLEYGAEFPGDIGELVSIAQPHVAVVTNVGPAHLEFFQTLDNVAREKATLILRVPATGRVILNADDQFADWMAKQTRAEVVRVSGEGSEFAKAVAVAVAGWFDVESAAAQAALEHWTPPAGRLVPLPGKNETTILDDTYNANPSSMTLALNTARKLAKKRGAKRCIVVLGDMLELGAEEARYHRGIALLAQKAADSVILVGRRFRGMPADSWFENPMEAADYVDQLLEPGDIILVKGSQGMRMEFVVEALLAHEADRKRLVRQSSAWKAKPFVQP